MKLFVIHAHTANRGDEAAVKAMVDEILSRLPDTDITISLSGLTPYPNMNEKIVQIGRIPKVRSVFSRIEFMLFYISNGRFCLSKEFKEFKENVKKADIVIHAPGGPSIGDIYEKDELLYLLRLDLVRKLKRKYMFYAPSMGPFCKKKNNGLRKKVLKGAELILLRDPISVSYLRKFLPEIRVEQVLDSALQNEIDSDLNQKKLENYSELKQFLEKYDKCLGITITNLRWHPHYKNSNIETKIINTFTKFIDKRIKEGYGILFIPQLYGTGNDKKIMSNFMKGQYTFMLTDSDDEYDTYFQQFVISKLYAVIGMRYHSNIFSAKMGVPFVSISYEQKMQGFMEMIGLERYCINLESLCLEKLEETFSVLNKQYSIYRETLYKLHETMKNKAYRATECLVKLLVERKES